MRNLLVSLLLVGPSVWFSNIAVAQNLFEKPIGVITTYYEIQARREPLHLRQWTSPRRPTAWHSTATVICSRPTPSNSVYKFTPSGSRSTFATGLNFRRGLAFDTAAICSRPTLA